MPTSPLYEADFYAWAQEQAALLRTGQIAAADLDNIAEEIESMGRSEKRELLSRLQVLLTHLLKWQYQPSRRGRSWQATIRLQRREVVAHLRDNPSLKTGLADLVSVAYERAVIAASGETDLPETHFPAACPWDFSDILAETFWPEAEPGA